MNEYNYFLYLFVKCLIIYKDLFSSKIIIFQNFCKMVDNNSLEVCR